jgi:hypothetical protein
MSERTVFRGMLVEKKMKYRAAKAQCEGLVISLRGLINPFEEAEDLQIELIKNQADQLFKICKECNDLRKEIRKIEQELEG